MLSAFITPTSAFRPRLTMLTRWPGLTSLSLRVRGKALLIAATMPHLRVLANMPAIALPQTPFPDSELVVLDLRSARTAVDAWDAGPHDPGLPFDPEMTGIVIDTEGDQIGIRCGPELVGIDRIRGPMANDAEAAVTALERELVAILGAVRLPDVHDHDPDAITRLAGLAAPVPLTLFSPLIGVQDSSPTAPGSLSAPLRDMLLHYWQTKLDAAPSVHLDLTIAILVDPVRKPPQI